MAFSAGAAVPFTASGSGVIAAISLSGRWQLAHNA